MPIASNTVNAIAMAVLPDAPIDPATGLRVPTIAVATAGGVSVIKHDGTVVSGDGQNTSNISITPNVMTWFNSAFASTRYLLNPGRAASGFSPSFYDLSNSQFGSAGNTQRDITAKRNLRLRSLTSTPGQVKLLCQNDAVVQRGVSGTVTNTFNTGWLPGDVRRCFLSDTSNSALAGEDYSIPTLVLANLTIGANVTVTDLSDRFRITKNATDGLLGSIYVDTAIGALTVGRLYFAEFEILATGPNNNAYTGATHGGGGAFIPYGYSTGNLVRNIFSIATGAGHGGVRFSFSPSRGASPASSQAGDWIEISKRLIVRSANPDLSYRGRGLLIDGIISRAALATGTSLVGYSGFSAANYLREPYSADLDFGTGEWSCSAWVNVPAALPLSGVELVTNGTFDVDANWTNVSGGTGTAVISSGVVSLTSNIIPNIGAVRQVVTVVSGKTYRVSWSALGGPIHQVMLGTSAGGSQIATVTAASTTSSYVFTATGATLSIELRTNNSAGTVQFDNISVQEIVPTAVAERAFSSGPRIRLGVTGAGLLTAEAFDGVTTRTVTTSNAYNTASWLKAEACYTTDGTLSIRVNGREVATSRGNPLLSLNSRYNQVLYSQDFANAAWLVTAGFSSKASTAVTDPLGGTTACEIAFIAANGSLQQNSVFTVGKTYTISFWSRRDAGSNVLRVATNTGTSLATFSPTSSWQKFTFTVTVSSGNHILFQDTSSSGWTNVQFAFVQGEEGSTAKTYQRVGAATDFDFQAPLTIGNNFAVDAPFPGSIALLKLSATVPTYEQSQFMYEQEKQLFRAGAQSVLPDSGSIVDMAYDDATDRWVAVSATNESYWTGLVRNSVTPVPAGSYTRVVAGSGLELVARSTTNPGVDVTIPAYGLREELVKRAEAAARLTKEIVTYDYVGGFTANTTNGSTAITNVSAITYPASYIGARISGSGIPANTTIVAVSGTTIYLSAAATATASGVSISFLDFELPVGMEAKNVMSAGALRREGSTQDYTRLYDGFIETIRFAVAPGATAWVQIQAQRITLQ